MAHSYRSLSRFLQREAARSISVLPLDGMLVHCRPLPRNLLGFSQQFAGTHLYSWVERGTVRVKCLAQEHNTVSAARARTRTACSLNERTNHEATALPNDSRSDYLQKKIQIKYYSCHELTMKSLRKQQMNHLRILLKEHDVCLVCHTCFDVTHIFFSSKCIYAVILRGLHNQL